MTDNELEEYVERQEAALHRAAREVLEEYQAAAARGEVLPIPSLVNAIQQRFQRIGGYALIEDVEHAIKKVLAEVRLERPPS